MTSNAKQWDLLVRKVTGCCCDNVFCHGAVYFWSRDVMINFTGNRKRNLTREQEYLAKHYGATIFQFESDRLEKHCPVEFAITCRYLGRHVPIDAVVADVGVGVGHYSQFLAQKGCSVHLIDISVELLRAAQERLERSDLGGRIQGIYRASATELGCIESGSLDALLMLGPLYHLREPDERRRAVREARRVLKSRGMLFAAAVNRMAYLRDLFREKPEEVVMRKAFHRGFLKDGKLDPEHAQPIGYAHLTTVSEFRKLFKAAFEELALVGTDSFLAVWQSKLADFLPDTREAWLDLVEETGKTPEGLGQSDHFLFVGRKR
jgi:ubiquinone/menaquinone biosynthesis C-methylase UbiE